MKNSLELINILSLKLIIELLSVSFKFLKKRIFNKNRKNLILY